MMPIVAGIDYSMTCPAICVHAGDDWSFDNCNFLFITKEKKYHTSFLSNKIEGREIPTDYSNDTERFAALSRISIDYLDEMGCDNVMIEGYAMGAKGLVFNIAENTGTLKFMLMNDFVDFCVTAPTVIKKFATGKGNSDKSLMYEAFLAETKIDLRKEFDYTRQKVESPIGDLVDAYYICKYHHAQIKEKNKK